MGLFNKTPYHFPNMRQLGEWEWNPTTQNWKLHLHPRSKTVADLRLTMHFGKFNDERVKYSHLVGASMDPEDLISATITVNGADGREYFWQKMSEHWRSHMNAGKKTEPPCDFPFPVTDLPIWSEDSKTFFQHPH